MKKLIILILTIICVLSIIVASNKLITYKNALANEAQIYPEEIQDQEVIVSGEVYAPEGFPHMLIFPTATLINSEFDSESITGYWQTNEELPIVVAWQMFKLYDSGWYMKESPSDPSSITSQSFTAVKENDLIYLSATSNGEVTSFSVKYLK